MENNPQFDRELLSSYLDNVLSSSERQQAEALLASEPAAARYLESLRTMRQSLQSLSNARLPVSFADRVLQKAKQQAAAEQLPSNHYILAEAFAARPADNRPGLDQEKAAIHEASPALLREKSSSRSRWTWSVAAALAASVLWVAVAVYRQNDSGAQLAQDPSGSDLIAGPETLLSPQLANAATGSPERVTDIPNSVSNPNMLPGAGVNEPAPSSTENPAPARIVRNSGESPKPDADGSLMLLDLMFVMDVVMTPEAWDAGQFDKLLARSGLPITKAMRADKELLTAIVNSRVVLSPEAAAEKSNQPRSEIALIFVQCKAADLERIAVEIESDKQSYSDLTYDIGLDDHRRILARLLRKTAGKPSGKGEAKMIVPDGDVESVSGLFPAFVAPVKEPQPLRTTPDQLQSRATFKSLAMLDSEVLIVLRKQSPQ